jgi:outer membrane receptor for ferrienterochelin and colicins
MQFYRMQVRISLMVPLLLVAAMALGAPALAQDNAPKGDASREGRPNTLTDGPAGAAPEQERGKDLRSLSLEELMEIEVQTVVSASKYRQKVSEAPASITIITADDIKKFGYRTLADILRSVRGLYTTYDRNYDYIGIRGFGRPGDYNTRILLLVDGHRINDAIYASAAIGTEFILDVDLIERVEVTRGPGSSLYGSNAFFGVVNVITRRSRDTAGTELSAEAASEQTYKGRLTYGNRAGKDREALLSATGYASAGGQLYFSEYDPRNPLADPRAANNGFADAGDGDRFQSGYGKFSSGGFQLSAAAVQRTKVIPTASYGVDFNDPGNRTTDKRAYLDAQYSVQGSRGAEYTFRGYYDVYQYSGDYLYSGTVNQDRAYGTWYGGEARVTARVLSAHRVIAGAEYETRGRQDQWNGDAGAAGTVYLDDRRRSQYWAVYAQDEITISPVFLIYAGVRHDQVSTFGGSTNPRLAAVIKPVENGTLKLLYGKAFRAPTVYEMRYEAPPAMLSNPGLKPEQIETYELVYEHDFGRGLRAAASRYSYSIRHLITQTADAFGSTSFQNIERAEATGTELEVQKSWQNGINGRLNYTNQKARNPETGELLTNAPENLAKLNVVVPLMADRLFAGLEEQYTGSRTTVAGQRADGFFMTNLTLFSRNQQKTVEVSVSVYNLLDAKYADPVSADLHPLDVVQQDGRTFRVKLTYAF